ncbi:MAG: hypothetical protein AAFR23_05700, partial [Pseudomonadota bacterium]
MRKNERLDVVISFKRERVGDGSGVDASQCAPAVFGLASLVCAAQHMPHRFSIDQLLPLIRWTRIDHRAEI